VERAADLLVEQAHLRPHGEARVEADRDLAHPRGARILRDQSLQRVVAALGKGPHEPAAVELQAHAVDDLILVQHGQVAGKHARHAALHGRSEHFAVRQIAVPAAVDPLAAADPHG